ncbi:YkuS family protein [Planococcus salinus]|uniref:Gas vesicle protein n=1 Tax=Planococcus salinus TaxID=1848460 RepID=A0A3M8P936_9BACL|nr:YkuS family protein [Planococcus salinus]RNF39694.1 hypothetical protein EEX84_06910 [Planococcus salinus]
MVRIAVEEPFTSVHQALIKRGYKAEMLDDKTNSMNYDCVVVRDKEDLADFHMNVPLVEAKGRTLQEIIEEVEERLVRSGKIAAPKSQSDSGKSGGGFIAGVATGAIVGAAAGLLLTPKSGKEMQGTVKEKITEMKEKQNQGKDENQDQGPGKMDQMKEKLGQVKEKASGVTEKASGMTEKAKAKREEMKEDKELKKREKEIEKNAKAEEKAQKEHEKAEKQVEKEQKKADKEAKQGGGVQLEELGDASVEKNSTGDVTITSDDNKNK